jgi:SAM-dependent methyltransferase
VDHDQAAAVYARVSADKRTLAFYDAESVAYAAGTRDTHLVADFITELPRGARVLDLGCGGGAHSAAMRDAGLIVTSADASAGLAAEAKRLWDVDVRVMRFDELDLVDAFDGVWASASLHHARVEELPSIFSAILRATKIGGVFHATLKAGVDRRDGRGRFFCAMSEDTLLRLVADWRDVRIDGSVGPGYEGELTPWLRLRAVR